MTTEEPKVLSMFHITFLHLGIWYNVKNVL